MKNNKDNKDDLKKYIISKGWKEVELGWWQHKNIKEFGPGLYNTQSAYVAQLTLENE